MIGTTVGNYVIKEQIGAGGMGAVYLAEHPRIGRRVAVKVLLPQLGGRADLVQRFFNEARAATATKNEHIIDVIDFGELADGSSYIVMEWLEGASLTAALQGGRMPIERTLHIAEQMADALAAAHAQGIVHRDLKPDNVFLIARGKERDFVKVLDFGIAKLSVSGGMQTQTQTLLGTPYYMAPEQWQGTTVDARTDVYAFGVMLHEMLAGQKPFNGNSMAELCLQHTTREPPLLGGDVPAPLAQVVRQAMAKAPEARFPSVSAFVEALVAAAAGRAAAVQPVATAPGIHRNVLIGGGVAVGILAVVAIAVFARSPAQPPPQPKHEDVQPTPAPPSPPPPQPQPAAPEPAPHKKTTVRTTWSLTHTNCPPPVAKMSYVKVRGTEMRISPVGYPDVVGTVDAGGHFAFNGTLPGVKCRGQVTGKISRVTCTNLLRMSCVSTYALSE
jgi:serine/threonine protein kinase